jgi:hypothetical protein
MHADNGIKRIRALLSLWEKDIEKVSKCKRPYPLLSVAEAAYPIFLLGDAAAAYKK